MKARSCILHSWKSTFTVLAVFLLLLALPSGIAHAAEASSGEAADGDALVAAVAVQADDAVAEPVEADGGEVTDGDSFVAALGGQATYAMEDGVCVVTLTGDVAMKEVALLNAGSYKLTGEGVISHGGEHRGLLLKVTQGVTLEIAGSVILDGGAVWTKDGVPTDSAVGATNEGATGTSSIVDNIRGNVIISENAVLRNTDNYAALYVERGTATLNGGSFYGNRAGSSYSGAIYVNNGTMDMNDGDIWGNVGRSSSPASAIYGTSSSTVKIFGGSVHDNAGPVAVSANTIEVSGGTFSNNLGSALGRCSSSATISGGTFDGNLGGAYANTSGSSLHLKLSDSPVFKTEADAMIGAMVELVGNLGDDVSVCMQLSQYWMGDQVLYGDAALLEAYHSRFSLDCEDDALIVNAAGKIDTDPSSLVNSGADLVAVLGGEEVATSAYDEATDTYTVTLAGDVRLPRMTYIESGSYVLTGEGTITHADGYTGALFKTVTGSSLEVSGSVVLDGGAVWMKDGVQVDSAVGAKNEGTVATMSIVDNYGGILKLSGNAVVRNNDGHSALYCDKGTLIIEGGSVYGNGSSNGGGAIKIVNSSNATITGGDMWGNAVTYGGSAVYAENSTVKIEGGTFRDGSSPAAVAARYLTVTGGFFTNNAGAAIGTYNSTSVELSGGTFEGNANGAFACTNGTTSLKLSGKPVFVTDADATLHSTVQLVDALDESVRVRLQPSSYALGDKVVTGSEELLEVCISQFTLVSDDEDLVVNADGRVDTATTSLITNGDDLAAALGGMGSATSSYDEETGVYTVTLIGDVALSHRILIEGGNYVLTGTGTISRSDGYQGVLLKNVTGTSLEITGSIVIDGGAVWVKDGEQVESAVGATNTGATSNMALVDNYGGALKISGDAILRNNDGNCAAYCDNGTLEITGGQIYGIRSKDGGGAVRTVSNSTVTIEDGEFWGNVVTNNARGSAVDGENSTVTIEGGTFRDSSGPAVVAARNLTVEGGTFTNNQGAALGTRSSNSVELRGGTFNGNAGGAFACTNGTTTLKLSGSPDFVTDTDATVHSTVQLVDELGERVMVRIQLDNYEPGQKVLTGDEGLIATYHSRFSLVDADGEYVVSASGEIDANPAEVVDNGDAFAAALGEKVATSSYDEEADVYTITLSGDVALSCAIEVKSGSYVLTGERVISRASGYTAALFQIVAGASLEVSGKVTLDGGAKWMKDGEQVESAVGSANVGVKSIMALVSSYGGDFKLSGSAVLRNNDGTPALYANKGSLRVEGGSIYGNHRAGYGAAVDFSQATFEMTDGSIWGNVGEGLGAIIRGGTSDSPVQISGGSVSDNAGSVAVAGSGISVSGGKFSGNSGAVLGVHGSGSASVSGGAFQGNPGGVFTSEGEPVPLQLSGSPSFATDEDATVHATVQLAGELADGVKVRIQLDSYLVGDQVLSGDAELVKAYYKRFTLISDAGFVVDSAGRVDTDPTSFVNDGDAFAAVLGGEGVATSSYDKATGVYTITLSRDVELTHAIIIKSGSYVLTGTGTISRGGTYTNALLKIGAGASLEVAGNVVLDGGAVWLKNGEPVESVTESDDMTGIVASWAMIENGGGDFKLSDNATLRNNYEYPALYSQGGTVTIAGGSIYGNGTEDGVMLLYDASLEMTDGDIWGNWGNGILYGYTPDCSIQVSGGSLHDNWCWAAALAYKVSVSGGTFSKNDEFAVGGEFVAISGGTFSGNYGAVYTYGEEAPGVVQLSGAPVFDGEYDVVVGDIEVVGPLTGSDVQIYPLYGDDGVACVRGGGSYTLTEADAAKFSLPGFDVPPGYYLEFDPDHNQIGIAYATAVLLEATAAGDAVFDDAAIEPGADFNVKVFKYVDGVKGEDITANYAVGGGLTPITYRYRSAGATVFSAGLPSTPGTYEVQAIAAADKANGYASGRVQFTLSITGGFSVSFRDGQGNVISIDWVVSGAAAKAPADPVREGFTFKGWDTDFSHVTSNLVVTALWEKASVGPGDDESSIGPVPAASKADNLMVVKAKKTVKVKASKLKKKAVKIKRKKAIAVGNAAGAVTYKLKSVKKAKFKKYFKVTKKTGKIKVKKGLEHGTYRLKIAVTAAGDASYNPVTKVVTVKVKVK